MSTKETPVKSNSVKGSNFNNKPRGFRAEKGVCPLNDVFDKEKGELIPGLTDEEKIAHGYQPPHQYENAVAPLLDSKGRQKTDRFGKPLTRQIGRFEKSDFERKELKRVHSSKKGPTGGAKASANVPTSTLIVHVKNLHKKYDYKDFKKDPANKNPVGFKTTYAFPDVKETEIFQVLSSFITLDRGKKDDHVLNYVNKYYFNGKTYKGNSQ